MFIFLFFGNLNSTYMWDRSFMFTKFKARRTEAGHSSLPELCSLCAQTSTKGSFIMPHFNHLVTSNSLGDGLDSL